MNPRPTNSRKNERLQRIRDGGHLRFVLLYGLIAWGVRLALALAFLSSWREERHFLDALPRSLLVFGVGGVLFGEMMWWSIRIRCDRIEPRPPA